MEGLWDESQGGSAIGDLVLLEDLSNEAIENVLRMRYASDLIYCYIGNVLISVNPFKNINGLYSSDTILRYKCRYPHEAPPHIFAIAETNYRQLNSGPQCIIICGESGAGKTEASKKIMQYIAAVAGSGQEIEKVKEQLLKSNPLLEAFGNAKTLRNNNSSRFGKYFEMYFDYGGSPIGGRVQDFLLEKSRVVQPSLGERSFHIFYQLLKGATHDEKKKYILKPIHSYHYLQKGDINLSSELEDYRTTTDPDIVEFSHVRDAMSALNISDEELDSIFRTLSAVLWIGEIEFDPKGDASAVAQKSFDAIDNIAELLKIERELLMNCFTKRETKVSERSKETITRIHKPEEARYARDAWAKTMYARLFDWIIQKINHSIFPSKAIGSSIGVLDIYGFEVFQTNGFEQFCINYVNEKLQHVFIERTIKLEQEEYHQENIPWTQIDYFNNKIVCDLIESKQNGLISLLNETCLTPKGGDEYFFNLVRDNLSEHPHISSPDVKTHRLQFTVKHYAGDVEYSLHGFVDKNKDLVWKDLMNCGHSSKLEFLRSLFPEKEILELGQKRPVTAGTQFKDQVSHLVETLCKCTPHYIRCVKPNDIKKPVLWSEQRVLHQVKYLGLLENVKVRRAGYAYRQNLVGFLNRYKMVCPETWPNWDAKNAAHGCSVILEYIGVNGDGFKLGKTKIFVQNPRTMIELEVRRADKIKQLTLLISACSKAKAPRVFYHEYKAAKALQTAWRRMKALKFYTEFKAAEVLQSKMKGALFRTTKVQYIACTFLQRSWRYHASRKWGISTRLFLNEEVTPFKDRRKMSADFFPVRCYLPELLKSGAIEELFKPTGDSNILFVQRALKYGTKFKIRERVVIVSNLAVFDCEWFPEKKKERALKLHHRFALHSLTQISLLPKHDNFVVLHMPTQYDLAYSMNYKSEFISILSERYQVLVKKKLNIKVLDTITMVMKDKKHRSLVTGSVQDRMEKGKHDKLETFSWIELDKKNHDIAYVNVLSDPIAPKDSFTCIQLIPASELAKLVKPAIAENHQGIPSDVKSDSEDPVQAPAEVNNTRKVSINSTPSSMPSSEEPSSLVDDQNTKPSTVDDPPQNIPTQITTAEAESN